MSKLHKIITVILRSFSIPIFSFALSILGIRFFGKQNWGEFIYVLTTINLFAFIGNFGNKDFLLRKYSNKPSEIFNYFSTSFFNRLLLLLFSIPIFLLLPIKTASISFFLILLIYIYQSFDSLIIYHQNFIRQLIAECLGFIIISGFIIYYFDFNITILLFIYIISYLFKIAFIFIIYRNNINFKNVSFSLNELKESFPFFLIIFSGWIASKIDLYIVNFQMSKENIAEYQLGITAFLLLQSLSYLIILPFNKHLYRLKLKTIQKIKNKISYASIPIITIGTIMIWLVLEKIALLSLPNTFYLFGALASFPTYFFIIDIILYYRNNNEKVILKINFICALINLILTYIFIRNFGIVGAMMSVFITQYIILIFYKLNLIK